jgi:hypothetical protein
MTVISMFFTYIGPHHYTFEIIRVERHLTPIRSLVSIDLRVFENKSKKEVAKVQLGQIPMTSELYVKETQWYPECPQRAESYETDIRLALTTFGSLLTPSDDDDYDLRVYNV